MKNETIRHYIARRSRVFYIIGFVGVLTCVLSTYLYLGDPYIPWAVGMLIFVGSHLGLLRYANCPRCGARLGYERLFNWHRILAGDGGAKFCFRCGVNLNELVQKEAPGTD